MPFYRYKHHALSVALQDPNLQHPCFEHAIKVALGELVDASAFEGSASILPAAPLSVETQQTLDMMVVKGFATFAGGAYQATVACLHGVTVLQELGRQKKLVELQDGDNIEDQMA